MGWSVEHRQGLDALLVERPLGQVPVPVQTKPGARLPEAETLGPNYGFSGSHPPNQVGKYDGRIPFLVDLGCF
jgi:hypothetical protein